LSITPSSFFEKLIKILEQYDFPGNIGELKCIVEDTIKRYKCGFFPFDGALLNSTDKREFNEKFTGEEKNGGKNSSDNSDNIVTFGDSMPTWAEMEAIYPAEIVERSGRDYNAAARMADLNKKTLIKHMKKNKEFSFD